MRLIEHFVSGSTARCAALFVGVNKSTAAYYFHRLRELILYSQEQEVEEVFDGEIELDESYFGGAHKEDLVEAQQGKCLYSVY